MGNSTFEDMAMRITPSPPPSQGSASTVVESKYLFKVKAIHYARIGLSVIFVALGTAAVASEGHALQVYNHTHLDSQWWLPLWPQYFDLRQTVTVLIGSTIIVFTSLVYIIAALIPSPHSRTTLLSLLFTALTFFQLLTLLITLGYTIHLDHQDTRQSRTNIRTWTCRWSSGVSGASVATSQGASESASSIFGENGGIEAPDGFGRLCRETKAAWALTITMVSLVASVGLAVVGYGWWIGFGVWRERRSEAKKWGGKEAGFGGAEEGVGGGEWVMQNQQQQYGQVEHGVAREVN